MANFQNNAITDSGRSLLSHVQIGAVFTPTKIVIGSGYMPPGKTARTMTAVVTPVKELVLNKKERTNDAKAIFGGVYSNQDISKDWYFRELALYAKAVYEDGREIAEVLYSYGNAGDQADLMPAYTTGQPVERQMDLVVYIGNDAKVNLTIEDGIYITYEQVGKPSGVASLGADGKVPEAQLPEMDYDAAGSAEEVQSNLNIHANNKSNPHGVTAEQVGAVPKTRTVNGKALSSNITLSAADVDAIPSSQKGATGGVATLDESGKVPEAQLPEMDYDAAGSAEAVQTALNSHTANMQNPHSVTAQQAGADPAGSAASAVSDHNQDEKAHPSLQAKFNGVSMAVKATYPVAEGQTIQAGGVVDVTNGNVTKSLEPQPNEKIVFASSSVGVTDCSLFRDGVLCFYGYSGSSNTAGKFVRFTDGKMAAANYYPPSSSIRKAKQVAIDDSHFILIYTDQSNEVFLEIHKYTESNNSFERVGRYTGASVTANWLDSVMLSTTSFLLIYNNYSTGGLKARVCTFSGTNITLGNEIALQNNTSASSISATRLPDEGTTRRACVCYVDGGDSSKSKAVVVAIDTNGSATWGTPASVYGMETQDVSCAADGANNVFIAYSAGGRVVVSVKKASGTSLSGSYSKSLETTIAYRASIAIFDTTIIVTYDKSNRRRARALKYTGSALTVGADYTFSDDGKASALASSIVLYDKTHAFVSYADTGNSDYGTATILTVEGDQIAGSFTTASRDAIALQSGTAGQSIEVIYSGTVAADWVTEGQVIESTGVYGAGVLDGILQVWSSERPRQAVTGSYIGTGKSGISNSVTLTFDSPPKCVIVQGYDYGSDSNNPNPFAGVFINPGNANVYPMSVIGTGNVSKYVNFKFSGKTVSWYAGSAETQLNSQEQKYGYIALF